MPGSFEIKTTSSGKVHFVLKAANGRVILSSQQYANQENAEKGIVSVRANAHDDARYQRKTSKNDEPYFVLQAGNGEIIAQSETYSTVASMEKGIASVKANAPNAPTKVLAAEKKKAAGKK